MDDFERGGFKTNVENARKNDCHCTVLYCRFTEILLGGLRDLDLISFVWLRLTTCIKRTCYVMLSIV